MSNKNGRSGVAPQNTNAGGKGLGILALFALIGFGAIYVTLGRPDNAAIQETAGQDANAGAAQPSSSNKMAAFVRKKSPQALPEITFSDAGGKTLTLADFKGKTILLNLWATWCAPCREEMPALDRLQKDLGSDRFEVVALSLDRKGVEASKKFLDETNATSLKLYVDATAKQGTALKIVGMPTTILIDKNGQELGRLAGSAEWDSDDAKKLIEAALQ
ncbi:MAG TPA: TlpA disulfide reductase family protein [Hyphomicrobium sp.]|nr:TlpA disulfide reductase family protein [Hyphomicrobium sp.]